jgi:hypothetical protein
MNYFEIPDSEPTLDQGFGPVATPGFAIELTPTTPIAQAIVMCVDLDSQGLTGTYQYPIGLADTINEARALAASHTGSLDPDKDACPAEYVVWARGLNGRYAVAARIEV